MADVAEKKKWVILFGFVVNMCALAFVACVCALNVFKQYMQRQLRVISQVMYIIFFSNGLEKISFWILCLSYVKCLNNL